MARPELSQNVIQAIAKRIAAVTPPYDLHTGQKRLIRAMFEEGKRRILVVAGRSWGKSAVAMFATARLMCLPGKKCFIVGPTRKQQKEIMWEQEDGIKSFFPAKFNARTTEAEQRIELPWGSSCKIDGSEMHQAFRGVAYDLMVLDEAQDQDWRFYDASYPNLSKKNGILLVIGTLQQDMSNPFMKKWQEALNDPSWCVINAPSWENEKIRPWLEEEKAKYFARGDEAEWIREFEAKYATGGNRAVFKPFKPALHVKPLDVLQAHMAIRPYEWEYWTVSDPGTKSVFAVTFHALNRATSEAFQLAEIYETDQNLTTPRQIWGATLEIEKRVYPKDAQVNRVYDEAAAWFSTVIASEFGVGMMPTTKDSREKMDDFGVMKDSMLAGKWCYAEDCVRTIAEIGGYRVKPDGSLDEKAPDHAIDCNRYFVRMANYTVAVHYTNRDIITREINRRLGVDELAPGEPDGIEDVEADLDLWG